MNDPRQGKPSGSSFDRLVACPGSLQLIKSLPPPTSTEPDEDAERGTRLHQAWKKEDPSGLPPEDIEDYEAGLRHIASLLSTWQSETGVYEVRELPREEREWFNSFKLEPILSGEMDRRYVGKVAEMLILDTKSGWLTYVPPAKESWQLRCYAVISAYNFGVVRIRVAFVKPKSKAEPIDYCDYTQGDLGEAEKAILFHIWESEQPNAPRHPGVHCRFCPAKASCPEAGAYYLLPSVIAKENGLADIAARVNALTPADLLRIWEAMPVITKIGEAVKARLKGFTFEELAALGLRKGNPKKLNPIVKTGDAFAKLSVRFGISEEDLYLALAFSNQELVEIVKRKFTFTQSMAKAWIAQNLKECIEEKTSDAPLLRV